MKNPLAQEGIVQGEYMQSTGNIEETAGASCRKVELEGDGSELDSRSNLLAYGAFIVQRLHDDLSSYKNAGLHVPGLPEREVFKEVSERKVADMVSLREGMPAICRLSRSHPTSPASFSSIRYWLDVDLNPIRSVRDAIQFTYLREYSTLNLFQRLHRLAKTPSIEAMFDAALWRQRETILWLDAAVIPVETREWKHEEMLPPVRQGVSWALIAT